MKSESPSCAKTERTWPALTASKEWRYEVTCDTCLQCDADGYANRADVLAAYSANAEVRNAASGAPDCNRGAQ